MSEKSPVYFVSLGCPKNLVDSQVMLGLLEKDRYSITNEPNDAEVIIVNTCSFIQASKEESIETILEMAQLKESAKCKVLVASGCLSQRYSKDLEKEMPEVDLFIGTGQYHRITELLNHHGEALRVGAALPQRSYVDQPAFIHTEKDPRTHTGPTYSAFLKLSEGCNRRCAFCIIPALRGNVRSRTIESLVTEAREMASRGVRELNLVAQDLTEYGMEWKYKERLETLLPELCKVEGIDWIRLHYVYPDQFSDELVAIIAREPKIVKYLDMPIQHTNDRVLKSMNRRLTKAKLFDLMSKLRTQIPGIVFRTSIIVGFPGEKEEDFEELCTDLVRLNIEHVGVFRYSKEEGTKAAEMAEQVHPGTKRRRAKKLIALLQEQSLKNHESYVGKSVQVLIEGPSPETEFLIQGRMPTQAQEIDGHVLLNDLGDLDLSLNPGDLVEAVITEALPHDLVGKVTRVLSPARLNPNAGLKTQIPIVQNLIGNRNGSAQITH
ncbi:MAG: 30S ribosomal protein S12 methylthiotransferase RimO [Bdellovibrio sp.]|nr:30S ribosomal protein S12 methylthiotransferase RimO [Bdellovibrio sp.]